MPVNNVKGLKDPLENSGYKSYFEMYDAGINAYYNSDQKDTEALTDIVTALVQMPLLLPVTVDMDLDAFKPGSTSTAAKEPKKEIEVLHLSNYDVIPLFTTKENTLGKFTVVQMLPLEYLPLIIPMGVNAVVNPFGGKPFIVSPETMKTVLLPLVKAVAEKGLTAKNGADVQNSAKAEPLEKANEPQKAEKRSFFGKLFSRDSSEDNDKKKVKAYCGNHLKEENIDSFFYGDRALAERVVYEITRKAFGTITDDTLAQGLHIYLEILLHSHGPSPAFMTPNYIRRALCKSYPKIPQGFVTDCINYSLEIIYAHEPSLKISAEHGKTMEKMVAQNAAENVSIERAHIGEADFGLIPSKPIFVNGFGQDKYYLDHLYTPNGVKLQNKRIGSKTVAGIAGPVDLYHLILPDKKIYMEIYICNYGASNTTATPKGLLFK